MDFKISIGNLFLFLEVTAQVSILKILSNQPSEDILALQPSSVSF